MSTKFHRILKSLFISLQREEWNHQLIYLLKKVTECWPDRLPDSGWHISIRHSPSCGGRCQKPWAKLWRRTTSITEWPILLRAIQITKWSIPNRSHSFWKNWCRRANMRFTLLRWTPTVSANPQRGFCSALYPSNWNQPIATLVSSIFNFIN